MARKVVSACGALTLLTAIVASVGVGAADQDTAVTAQKPPRFFGAHLPLQRDPRSVAG